MAKSPAEIRLNNLSKFYEACDTGEILRLRQEKGLSNKVIANEYNVWRRDVEEYFRKQGHRGALNYVQRRRITHGYK